MIEVTRTAWTSDCGEILSLLGKTLSDPYPTPGVVNLLRLVTPALDETTFAGWLAAGLLLFMVMIALNCSSSSRLLDILPLR